METNQNAWYVNFFGEDYLNIYRHTLTAERTEKEVAFAERRLELAAGARSSICAAAQGATACCLRDTDIR